MSAVRRLTMSQLSGDREESIDALQAFLRHCLADAAPDIGASAADELFGAFVAKLELDDGKKFLAEFDKQLLEKFGMKIDRRGTGDPNRELLRLGIRVESVARVGDDGAWVVIGGRNADDTRWKYSEYLRRRDGRWVLGLPPAADVAAKRPKDSPLPLQDWTTAEARERAGISQMLGVLDARAARKPK